MIQNEKQRSEETRLIVVSGIPGVGKTSVLETAMKMLREKKKYAVVNYGDVMFEIAMEKGLVKHRDEMRKLPTEEQKNIQKLAAKKIASLLCEKNVIIDTHMSIKTPEGYMPGLPHWVLKELDITHLILIESNPKEIYERRIKDETRKRDMESIEEIDMHQRMNRYFACSYAMITGASVYIIENPQGKLVKASKKLHELLE